MCSRLTLPIMSLRCVVWNAVNTLRLVYTVAMYLFPISLCTGLHGQLWSHFVIVTTHQTQFSDHHQAVLQHTQKKLSIGNYSCVHSIPNFIFWNGKKKKEKVDLVVRYPNHIYKCMGFCCPSILALYSKVDYCILSVVASHCCICCRPNMTCCYCRVMCKKRRHSLPNIS